MYLIYTLNPIALVINSLLVLIAVLALISPKLSAKLQGTKLPGSKPLSTAKSLDAAEPRESFLTTITKAYDSSKLFQALSVLLVLALGAFLRFYRLAELPLGLQQDEASIGYEAYILANFGIDRNGFAYPVYPITFGSGGGSPLMVYLNVISTKLFGSNVAVLRGTTAFCGCLTLLLFYILLRKLWSHRTAIVGLIVLTLTPWHIILSRWSLDSNTTPLWFVLPTLLFVMATKSVVGSRKQTVLYCLSAALYAVCMYSYGSSNIVVPIHILLICAYCIWQKRLDWKQLLLAAACFIVVVLPLAIFYLINALDLPSIHTAWFSIDRLTAPRESVFLLPGPGFWSGLKTNATYLIQTLTFGAENELISNAMPGYSTVFAFTFPVTFLGIFDGIKRLYQNTKRKVFTTDAVMLTLLIASLILGLLVTGRINRMVPLYLPVVYYFVMGLRVLYHTAKIFFAVSFALFLAGALLFTRAYFGHFNDLSAWIFMPGYGQAIEDAEELMQAQESNAADTTIYSTYEGLSSPFMLALYYSKTDPDVFRETVEYRDEGAEFRVAIAFGHYVFSYPDDIQQVMDDDNQLVSGEDLDGNIYIVHMNELDEFDLSTCAAVQYGDYVTIWNPGN